MNNIRNIFLIVCSTAILFSCNSKSRISEMSKNGIISTISFKKELHDFGSIPAKKDATTTFSFSNTGDNPLIITEVKTTCGCNVTEYPKEPLQSNENAEIRVTYDAKFPGRFSKTISVYYNGKDSPKELTVKGEVPMTKDMEITLK